jgi:nicotinic acid mononucleotide adenylyltransferase
MALSSTLIRDNLREGKSVRYMMPEKVFQYVDQERFYR